MKKPIPSTKYYTINGSLISHIISNWQFSVLISIDSVTFLEEYKYSQLKDATAHCVKHIRTTTHLDNTSKDNCFAKAHICFSIQNNTISNAIQPQINISFFEKGKCALDFCFNGTIVKEIPVILVYSSTRLCTMYMYIMNHTLRLINYTHTNTMHTHGNTCV